MKRVICFFVAVLCIVSVAKADLYLCFGHVTECHRNIVTVADRTGNVWDFFGSANGYVILVMDNNGTADITDDLVVNVI